MQKQMNEKELIERFDDALKNDYIYALYQPQYNHASGRIIGAEALMRWKDPEFGMQYPNDFIPVLENNNLIFKADIHIFEIVCRFIKKCIEDDIMIVPISVNMSRYDNYNNDYVEEIEKIRKKYDIPVKYLRIEMTESSAIGGMELIKKVLNDLHNYRYLVEMDDFGSGYSSLNVLKDLDVDIIKLDMRFLQGDVGGRGGIIISSIVRMSKWLKTPMIAEGVETTEMADYMRSIGCENIQGYLYSKPITTEEYIEKLKSDDSEVLSHDFSLVDTMNAGKFWSPESMETLIFSNFVGGACIFTYQEGKVELLRINKKYLQEIGMNISMEDALSINPWDNHTKASRDEYESAMKKAIETGDEVVSENWRTLYSKCCGEERVCIKSTIRVIGQTGNKYLFYAMVQNITREKQMYMDVYESERKFRFASEQVNIYAWEYDIKTKEMRPCFRCMRDLGLPYLVKNYPEPVIESGLFPPDYADMYRDWHKQLADGVESLEAIIPLTVGRVPFHVRYTLEKDDKGNPVKAYGSAALVVDKTV